MSDDFQAPADIWLQGHMHPETTWCVDQIEPTDVRYVRADRIEALEAEIERLQAEKTNMEQTIQFVVNNLHSAGYSSVPPGVAGAIRDVLQDTLRSGKSTGESTDG